MPNKIAVRMQILGGVSVCPLMGLIGRYNFYPKVLGRYIEHLSQLSVTRTRPPYTTIDADNRRSQSSKFRTLGPWRAWGGPAVLRTCLGRLRGCETWSPFPHHCARRSMELSVSMEAGEASGTGRGQRPKQCRPKAGLALRTWTGQDHVLVGPNGVTHEARRELAQLGRVLPSLCGRCSCAARLVDCPPAGGHLYEDGRANDWGA